MKAGRGAGGGPTGGVATDGAQQGAAQEGGAGLSGEDVHVLLDEAGEAVGRARQHLPLKLNALMGVA